MLHISVDDDPSIIGLWPNAPGAKKGHTLLGPCGFTPLKPIGLSTFIVSIIRFEYFSPRIYDFGVDDPWKPLPGTKCSMFPGLCGTQSLRIFQHGTSQLWVASTTMILSAPWNRRASTVENNHVGWTIVKRVIISYNYFPESDFSGNTKTQLALIDFQLEKFRASAVMVLHSQQLQIISDKSQNYQISQYQIWKD